MKVLLDECLPRHIKTALVGHEIQTVQDCGWSGRTNGDLLNMAEARFEVFLTSDQNLRYQQNLSGRTIAIIELPSSTLSAVRLILPEILAALAEIRPGDYCRIRKP